MSEHVSPETESVALGERWTAEYRDGARCAFLRRFEGEREAVGYPPGFPLGRRNAWFAGFNRGFYDRLRIAKQVFSDEI